MFINPRSHLAVTDGLNSWSLSDDWDET